MHLFISLDIQYEDIFEIDFSEVSFKGQMLFYCKIQDMQTGSSRNQEKKRRKYLSEDITQNEMSFLI